MLETLHILAREFTAVRLGLYPTPMLLIIAPLALVRSSVGMLIEALAVSLAFLPVALIHVTVLVDNLSFSIFLIVLVKALINRAI